MSDDLISRKAVLCILTEARVKDSILCSPAFVEMLTQRIKKIPTAFDKEKVIAKIDNASMSRCRYGFRNFDLSPRRCIDCQNDFIRAVYEIVEKGGIE